MPNSKYSVLLSFFSFLIFLTEATPVYSSHYCTDSITYQPNTTFQTNLRLSFFQRQRWQPFLPNKNRRRRPQRRQWPLPLPRRHLAAACHGCVSTATEDIKRRCPVEKEAIIWYDVCTLRYSDESLNNIVPATGLSNTKNIAPADKERFNELLAGMLNALAANSQNEKSATVEVNFTRTETLFGLVQCTLELTVFECNMCFRSAIAYVPNCCDGKRGATVLLPDAASLISVAPT